jgi:adenylate cyclase class 2
MPIEIEKKYRLTARQRKLIEARLRQIKAVPAELELEENIIYQGGELGRGQVLRLRRINGRRAILTFKERLPSESPVKHQIEEETEVTDPNAAHAILQALGFSPVLVYEKRRIRWEAGRCEVALDELPFGLFMEIEGSEEGIARLEKRLDATDLTPVIETYPQLTAKYGKKCKGVMVARLKRS